MTTLQEAAMRKALEALETCSYGDYSAKHVVDPSFDGDAVEAAIESLNAALAQQGDPEVLAHDNCRAERICRSWCGNSACISHTAAPAPQAQDRMARLYEVVGRCIEQGHTINITRLHDYCGGEPGVSAEAVDGGPMLDNEEPSFKLYTEKSVAVSNEVFWDKDMTNCPRGVKCQLLGAGGVATYGHYNGDPFWVQWAPLPKRRPILDRRL